MEADASTMHIEKIIHDNIPNGMCSTLMPSNGAKGGATNLQRPVIAASNRTIQTFYLTDTESETEPNTSHDVSDNDVEILEWIPGTEVKPVIKLENNMDWQ